MRSSPSFDPNGNTRPVNPFDGGLSDPVGEAPPHAPPMPPSARLVVKMLEKLSIGSLTVRFPDATSRRFGQGLPHAEIVLLNWNVCDAALKSGDIGFGETYIAGDWTTSDLLALMNVMVANRNAIEAVIYGTWWGRILYRVRHLMRRNTRTGSKKNVYAHYDIGNAFYETWLDRSMTYSSALFGDGRDAATANGKDDFAQLPDAQQAKYDRVLDQLDLPAGARVLEIGCGWGGFSETAGRRGFSVTGLTLSKEQFQLATKRVVDGGLADRVSIEIRDYRDVGGQYDGIASIEMFEAVGEKFWAGYFDCIKRRLKVGGRATIQTITIAEHLFPDYRKSSDFIQQYIFPGGMLPSVSAFTAAAQAAGLRVVDQFAFGQDYARTLAAWLDRFVEHERCVRDGGFDTAFVRTWSFYLAYCAAAFRFENTDVVQFTLEHDAG
ncbi:MAG: cyclopropane-fatty-acyl-phospholipid synthase family protein [Burkholderiaceae bacterium]